MMSDEGINTLGFRQRVFKLRSGGLVKARAVAMGAMDHFDDP